MKAIYRPDASVFHTIPKERMTVPYFENRLFFNGVRASYTKIRSESNLYQRKEKTHKPKIQVMTQISERLFSKIKKIYNPRKKTEQYPVEVSILLEKMEKSFQEGYAFHQEKIFQDPRIMEWALKEEYWECDLPFIPEESKYGTNIRDW
jgi:hypothetical protein